jgi:hypothetical protein
MTSQQSVLNLRFTQSELDKLRVIADRRGAERQEPVSLTSTARFIIKQYLISQFGDTSESRGGSHEQQQRSTV